MMRSMLHYLASCALASSVAFALVGCNQERDVVPPVSSSKQIELGRNLARG